MCFSVLQKEWWRNLTLVLFPTPTDVVHLDIRCIHLSIYAKVGFASQISLLVLWLYSGRKINYPTLTWKNVAISMICATTNAVPIKTCAIWILKCACITCAAIKKTRGLIVKWKVLHTHFICQMDIIMFH